MAHTSTASVIFAVLFVTGSLSAAAGSSEEGTTEGDYIDFSSASFAKVEAALGSTVRLPCYMPIKDEISWVRMQDNHILTVGNYVYTNDDRFRVSIEGGVLLLVIHRVKLADSGDYECFDNNTPHIRHLVHLSVSKPMAKILGGPTRSVMSGDSLNLTCVIKPNPRAEMVIQWRQLRGHIYHPYNGCTTTVEGRDSSVSNTLLIDNISLADAGEYTCHYEYSAGAGVGRSIDSYGCCGANVTVRVVDRRHESVVDEAKPSPANGVSSDLESGSTAETTTEEASGTGGRRNLNECETDETRGLALQELQRLVALKQLRVLRLQEEGLLSIKEQQPRQTGNQHQTNVPEMFEV